MGFSVVHHRNYCYVTRVQLRYITKWYHRRLLLLLFLFLFLLLLLLLWFSHCLYIIFIILYLFVFNINFSLLDLLMMTDQLHKILPITILSLLKQLQFGALQNIILNLIDWAFLYNGIELNLIFSWIVFYVFHFVCYCVHVVVYWYWAIT